MNSLFVEFRRFLDLRVPFALPIILGDLFSAAFECALFPCRVFPGRTVKSILLIDPAVYIRLVRHTVHRPHIAALCLVEADKSGLPDFGSLSDSADDFRACVYFCLNIVRLGSCALLGVDDLIVNDIDFVSLNVFHAGIERASRYCVFKLRFVNAGECVKNFILFIDFKSENAVQEFAHIPSYVLVEFEPTEFVSERRQKPEFLKDTLTVNSLNTTSAEPSVKLSQTVFGKVSFKVVVCTEHPATGVSLALCQSTKLIKTAGNRRRESLLTLDIGGNELVDWGARLVASVRSAEALHSVGGDPAGLKDIVNSLLLVFGSEGGVIRFSGSTSV